MKRFAIAVLVVFSSTSCWAQSADDGKTRKFLYALLYEDISVSLNGKGQTGFTFRNLEAPAYSVTAKTLTQEFEKNEIAAENKFKNVVFNLTGQIVAVKRDAIKLPYVEFATSRYGITNTAAYLTLYGADKASEYKPGQNITLRCRGASKDIVVKALKCQPPQAIEEIAKPLAQTITDDFLSGKDVSKLIATRDGGSAQKMLYTLKYASASLPDNSPCFDYKTLPKCDLGKLSIKDLDKRKEFIDAYNRDKKAYSLPDL